MPTFEPQALTYCNPSRNQAQRQLGVLLNHADTFHHFRGILAQLDPAQFEIVVAGDRAALEAIAEQAGYTHVWYQELLQAADQGPRYRYSLSNYYLYYYDLRQGEQVTGRVYLPQLLSQLPIRLAYSLGTDYWSYGDWNRIYALQLCYGPWQDERLQGFGGKVLQVGYPRYDDFFNQPVDKGAQLQALGADPHKPTLVWLPTRYQHTLRQFGEKTARLSERYNVLVKPHPATWREEPTLIRWLQHQPFTQLLKDIDTLQLYAVADYVICDYGGTAFGALYTDRPLLLFNHYPTTHFDPAQLFIYDQGPTDLASLNPTELSLRESIPSLDPGQQAQLPALLADQALWQAQQQVRAELRKRFFAPYYGNSAARVASILKHLLKSPASEQLTDLSGFETESL